MNNRKITKLNVKSHGSHFFEVDLPQDVDTVELFAQLQVFTVKENGRIFPISTITEYQPFYEES